MAHSVETGETESDYGRADRRRLRTRPVLMGLLGVPWSAVCGWAAWRIWTEPPLLLEVGDHPIFLASLVEVLSIWLAGLIGGVDRAFGCTEETEARRRPRRRIPRTNRRLGGGAETSRHPRRRLRCPFARRE